MTPKASGELGDETGSRSRTGLFSKWTDILWTVENIAYIRMARRQFPIQAVKGEGKPQALNAVPDYDTHRSGPFQAGIEDQ